VTSGFGGSIRGSPGGYTGGAILYSLNHVARYVEGPSIYPGSRLRGYVDDGEPVYHPNVLRALAPPIAASC
jgi:hypothetical protein